VCHDAGQAAAQQWLAAGEADLGDAQPLDRDPGQAGKLAAGQQCGVWQPVQALGGHAVAAAQVAPAGQ
jgi:hypothetical protein